MQGRMKDVLEVLMGAAGDLVSGEEIARELGVSRVMVNRYVQMLRDEGYEIAAEARGYVLTWPEHEFNPAQARKLVSGTWGRRIYWLPRTASTNDEAVSLVRTGKARHGDVVVARMQDRGRGRRGRVWESPVGGLWFSVVLAAEVPVSIISRLALVFPLAVARALTDMTGVDAGIKWPNDIMVGGRKLGGILLQLEAEAEAASYLVAGVGLNVNNDTRNLTAPVGERACSLSQLTARCFSLSHLFAAVIAEMEEEYRLFRSGGWPDLFAEYEQRCIHLGQQVTVRQGDEAVSGVNTRIGEDGTLWIMSPQGEVQVLAGDIVETARGI